MRWLSAEAHVVIFLRAIPKGDEGGRGNSSSDISKLLENIRQELRASSTDIFCSIKHKLQHVNSRLHPHGLYCRLKNLKSNRM